ncbi:MAG: LPS export ABC transporter permease LptF [Deltaproteobacteria bacterium]|nr:LPS export ABC transporter permease LptF [Deltaproteobacteria bacterium]
MGRLRITIMDRYVFFRFLPPFAITILVLMAVFLMTRVLDLTDLVVNYRVGLLPVALLLAYTLPYLFTFVFPMASMLAVLLTVMSMSSDSEIVALKAGGYSLWTLARPVLFFCLLTAAATSFMAIKALPWGRLAMKDLVYSVARKNIEVGLSERVFNDTFKNVVLYVNELDEKNKVVKHVFIEDHRRKDVVLTVTAPEGRLVSDPEKGLWQLTLKNGSMNQVDVDEGAVYATSFGSYDLSLDLSRVLAGRPGGQKDEEEMSLAELSAFMEKKAARGEKDDKYYLALMQLHKKFSMPAACLVLGLCAVPLGISGGRARRSFGVGLGIGVFLLYYLVLAAGEVFGEAGVYPPAIGMWMPNVVVGALGLHLYFQAAADRRRELPARVFAALAGRVRRLFS